LKNLFIGSFVSIYLQEEDEADLSQSVG